MSAPACPLCAGAGGELVWHDEQLRLVLPDEPEFPGFTRVIWQAHAAEMTDLAPADRNHLMEAVWTVEATMRRALAPAKINLASLGNMVPHLHWHVVPRWPEDARFPGSPWSPLRADAAAGNPAGPAAGAARARAEAARALVPAYRAALLEAFGTR